MLEQLGVYALPRVRWAVFAPVSAGISLATLLLVAWLAATRGRLYCNTICPVGALLGLFAKISFLRIGIDPGACKGCNLCEGVCKAGCIDSRKKTVDSSRCVSCYNCLAVCPRDGLRFENQVAKAGPRGPTGSRAAGVPPQLGSISPGAHRRHRANQEDHHPEQADDDSRAGDVSGLAARLRQHRPFYRHLHGLPSLRERLPVARARTFASSSSASMA